VVTALDVESLKAQELTARIQRLQRDAAVAQAERANTMREHVLMMFRNAAEQSEGGTLPVRDVFRQGAEQIFHVYKDQPEIGQTIALTLAEIYVHLGDPVIARELLGRLLQWPGIEATPGVQAEAFNYMAQVELESSEVARAKEWFAQAQAIWLGDPVRYALPLNTARGMQAEIERAEGSLDLATATLETAIAERRKLLGTPDRELATQLTSLVTVLLDAGRYEEAMTRADESIAVYESLGLGRSSAGLAAINNRASAAFRLGQNARAAADFRQAVDLRRELFGPTTELATNMNNLAVVLMREKHFDEVIPLLEEALQIAIAHGGDNGAAAFGPRRNLSDAYVGVGRIADAAPLAEAAVSVGREQFGATSVYAAAAYASRARVRLAQGNKAGAKADLDAATAIFTAMGEGGAVHLANLASLREELP